jgi:hypothetical protein
VAEQVEEGTDRAEETAHKFGHRMQETAKKVEHKVEELFGEGTATSCVSASAIQEHMDVLGSCGNKLGRVDHVQGGMIKLTRNGSSDGRHHYIPISWVSRVDDRVHLTRSCTQAKEDWQSE